MNAPEVCLARNFDVYLHLLWLCHNMLARFFSYFCRDFSVEHNTVRSTLDILVSHGSTTLTQPQVANARILAKSLANSKKAKNRIRVSIAQMESIKMEMRAQARECLHFPLANSSIFVSTRFG